MYYVSGLDEGDSIPVERSCITHHVMKMRLSIKSQLPCTLTSCVKCLDQGLYNTLQTFRAATPRKVSKMSQEMIRFAELVQALPSELYNEIFLLTLTAPDQRTFKVECPARSRLCW